jgi:hypothetical protein
VKRKFIKLISAANVMMVENRIGFGEKILFYLNGSDAFQYNSLKGFGC